MESIPSESLSPFTFKSKNPIFTPQKPPATVASQSLAPSPSAAIFTPDRSDPLPRIRHQNFAPKARKLSLAGSDLLDLDRATDSQPNSEDSTEKIVNPEESATLLPEKYEILCEFFNAMVSSIRLLRLKRLPTTFSRLCKNVSSLTDRRFSFHHLAQLKYIVPEVITVKKIRVQDEVTQCMKEELLITLEVNAVETDKSIKGTAGFVHLKEVLHSRIRDYAINHPKGDDVPEGELPQLFYKPKMDPELSTNDPTTPIPASHVAPSFKARFSTRALNGSAPEFSSLKLSPCLPEIPINKVVSTNINDGASETVTSIEGTPAKLASTPVSRPLKRALRSPDDDDAIHLPNKSVRLSLNFNKDNADALNLLPEHLVQSLVEKERKIQEEQDPVISQRRRREQLMAVIPKLFDMICLLFQSIRRSIVTKEELIHKIVAGHLDIVDRREVEEQLNLLLEIAPEYISENSCLSGDIVLRLSKCTCPESIRMKLLEAKRNC